MSQVIVSRQVDLSALPWPASQRWDAVAALAERADATAQEVAQAARDGEPPTRR